MQDILTALTDPSIPKLPTLDNLPADAEMVLVVVSGCGRLDLYDLTGNEPTVTATAYLH